MIVKNELSEAVDDFYQTYKPLAYKYQLLLRAKFEFGIYEISILEQINSAKTRQVIKVEEDSQVGAYKAAKRELLRFENLRQISAKKERRLFS